MTLRRQEFAASPLAVRQAREFARQVLSPGQPGGVCDEIVLVVSELATNAVVHARCPFEVVVEQNGKVRVEVRDGSPELPNRRMPSAEQEGGRGLWILEQVCDRWGITRDAHGKCIWCERDG